MKYLAHLKPLARGNWVITIRIFCETNMPPYYIVVKHLKIFMQGKRRWKGGEGVEASLVLEISLEKTGSGNSVNRGAWVLFLGLLPRLPRSVPLVHDENLGAGIGANALRRQNGGEVET